uniref:Uncharacterized protein n=1 Tax=Cucumis melo TaxID=3656 RepID=A0A9I9E112_CUCME
MRSSNTNMQSENRRKLHGLNTQIQEIKNTRKANTNARISPPAFHLQSKRERETKTETRIPEREKGCYEEKCSPFPSRPINNRAKTNNLTQLPTNYNQKWQNDSRTDEN